MSYNDIPLLSSEEALDEYFTALLGEELAQLDTATPIPTDTMSLQSSHTHSKDQEDKAALENVQSVITKPRTVDPVIQPEETQEQEAETAEVDIFDVSTKKIAIDTEYGVQQKTELERIPAFEHWASARCDANFQVLYFDVNGITFAAPLHELGTIHRIGEMSHLVDQPNWFLGLQVSRDNQYYVVDTAKWAMADRLTNETHKELYQYVIVLGKSRWGLAATELRGLEQLNVESVRWREQAGKRPWLAGVVKEKMCILIHVEAMVTMIEAGLNIDSFDL